jgi:hypothetical protein
MTPPIINSISPTIGPSNQWVYLFGSGFVKDETQVYFNAIQCNNVMVYSESQCGFHLSEDASGIGVFKVVTPDGTFTSQIEYTVEYPKLPPTITSVRVHPDPNVNWIYVDGTEFSYGQTNVSYNSISRNAMVYRFNQCGFSKENLSDVINSITLTTPNGSSTFQVNPPL